MGATAAKKRKGDLVSRMDAEAESLLASTQKASLETRVAIFGQVAKWVQVRNRLGEDEGSGLLDAYRRSIDAAQSAVAERESARIRDSWAPNRKWLGRHQRAAR